MYMRTRFRFVTAMAIALLLSACASAPPASAPPAPGATVVGVSAPAATPLAKLKQLTHDDLKAAAAYATAHGYPARAAMWTAIETQLTAAEGQVAACKAAIEAALPKPSADGVVGLATLTEIGAEAVAQGVSAAVKANCEPIVVPSGLIPLPRLP